MRRPGLFVVLVLSLVASGALLAVVGAAAAVPAAEANVWATADGSGPASLDRPIAQTEGEVVVVQTFAALPDRPGHVRATRSFEVPTNVESLRTSLPADATVTDTNGGFEQASGDSYEWTGGSRTPSITYRLAVNETGAAAGPEAADGRFVFADVGDWGLFQRPVAPINVRYRGSVSFTRRTAVDGPGAAGTGLVYVGANQEFRREAHGQTFRLVVPAAASLRPSREEIFASLSDAAAALDVGDRDEEVLVVAAPPSVDWARRGLQTGEADFYVLADEGLDAADSTWLHEYVHTRQDFNLTAESRWSAEGAATYFAALLAFEQDRIDFDAFRDQLDRGTERHYADATLAEPGTWTPGANYLKGSLVAGELDRRLRLATDSRADLQAVFRRLNEAPEPVDADDFVSFVREAGTDAVASEARRYTTTTATPDVWSQTEHGDAFGQLPARISYALPDGTGDGAYRVAGPFRNRTLATSPFVLVPGEQLAVDLRVENDGGTTGTYDVAYGRDGERAGTLTGSIDSGESRLETASVRFETVGDHTLRIGEFDLPVTVVEPARPTVAGLGVEPSAVAPGDPVAVTIDVENGAGRPAATELVVTADGREIAREPVRLDAGESGTVAVSTTFEETGDHRIDVGDRTATLSVRRSANADGTGEGTTSGGASPGPGPLVAALALLLAVALSLGAARVSR